MTEGTREIGINGEQMQSLGRALTATRPDVNVRRLVGNHGCRKGDIVVSLACTSWRAYI